MFFPGAPSPEYLNGSLAGDYGWDPLGLGADPVALKWYRQSELQHARWAMFGVAGILGQVPTFANPLSILHACLNLNMYKGTGHNLRHNNHNKFSNAISKSKYLATSRRPPVGCPNRWEPAQDLFPVFRALAIEGGHSDLKSAIG
eukprot:508528-Prorocentrum_minimum.AAC.4